MLLNYSNHGRKEAAFVIRKYSEMKSSHAIQPVVVSLPLSSYMDGPVDSAEVLYISFPLPPTWIIDNVTKVPLTLCLLHVSSGSLAPRADILITLTIISDSKPLGTLLTLKYYICTNQNYSQSSSTTLLSLEVLGFLTPFDFCAVCTLVELFILSIDHLFTSCSLFLHFF